MGSTVNVAADAALACGPAHTPTSNRAVARSRLTGRPAPDEIGGAGCPVEIAYFTQKVSDRTTADFGQKLTVATTVSL